MHDKENVVVETDFSSEIKASSPTSSHSFSLVSPGGASSSSNSAPLSDSPRWQALKEHQRYTTVEALRLVIAPEQQEPSILDAWDEECFTLEPFELHIQTSVAANREFILARVTTADPTDSSKQYHSHYSAFHINKVLFRTQPAQGLLHRMKAKNPLNNMPIVGDVLYFAVGKEELEQAWNSRNSDEKIVEYHCRFLGTDDNFLMQPSFREYFKINAPNSDDVALFSLNATGAPGNSNSNAETGYVGWRNLWGLWTSRSSSNAPPAPLWRRITMRGMQVAMVLYIVLGFVLIKFVFPANFAFLIGFIVIMFFLFTLLFLVDCEA